MNSPRSSGVGLHDPADLAERPGRLLAVAGDEVDLAAELTEDGLVERDAGQQERLAVLARDLDVGAAVAAATDARARTGRGSGPVATAGAARAARRRCPFVIRQWRSMNSQTKAPSLAPDRIGPPRLRGRRGPDSLRTSVSPSRARSAGVKPQRPRFTTTRCSSSRTWATAGWTRIIPPRVVNVTPSRSTISCQRSISIDLTTEQLEDRDVTGREPIRAGVPSAAPRDRTCFAEARRAEAARPLAPGRWKPASVGGACRDSPLSASSRTASEDSARLRHLQHFGRELRRPAAPRWCDPDRSPMSGSHAGLRLGRTSRSSATGRAVSRCRR